MDMDNPLTIKLSSSYARLDAALSDLSPEVSRAQIKRDIQEARVSVNGVVCTKPSRKVSVDDRIVWQREVPIDLSAPRPEDISLSILYEDDDILVIDKPAGLVVHPGAGNPDHTLVNALLHYDPRIRHVGDPARPGIVHRLDADTSGLLIAARSSRGYEALVPMFAEHRVHRQYYAIAHAPNFPDAGHFDTPYGRHPTQRVKYTSRFDAPRRAITDFRTVARTPGGFALITCLLQTGRTHQIRVHLMEHGAPILGDSLYAPSKIAHHRAIARLALHARKLIFNHPVTGAPCVFFAPFPDDFQHAADTLHLPVCFDHCDVDF